jgi:hypothetical protein
MAYIQADQESVRAAIIALAIVSHVVPVTMGQDHPMQPSLSKQGNCSGPEGRGRADRQVCHEAGR